MRATDPASLPIFLSLSFFLQGSAIIGLERGSRGAVSPMALSFQALAMAAMAVRWQRRLGPVESDDRSEESPSWWRWWERWHFLPMTFGYQGFGSGMLMVLAVVG